ncbi:NADH-ubiquinone oxidoreductase family protein [Ceratobasidium sp. AG-Ba]|nr:NADH-ubiquinone oxidoreductase family protein [Ceratobasidium sp. AG-Ba]
MLRSVLVRRAAPRVVLARTYATPVEFKQPKEDPQLGDYPNLPPISAQRRPAKGWWNVQERRNFGEPLPEQAEVLSLWSPDVFNISRESALKQFGIAVLVFLGFTMAVRASVPERPAVPRNYPYDGLVKELGGLQENKAAVYEPEEE